MLVKVSEGPLETYYGRFVEHMFYDGTRDAIALVMGDIAGKSDILCRIHSHCISAHIFNSTECDCREQMIMAQTEIQKAGCGIIIWLDEDGRGNGHFALLQSAELRAQGLNQSEAYTKLGFPSDARTYRQAREILTHFKIQSISLLSNSPQKKQALVDAGIAVSKIVPIYIHGPINPVLQKTYEDKKGRGHSIEIENAPR